MANVNNPFGARPVRHRSGAPYNGAARLYYLPSIAQAFFIGDLVALGGSSNSADYYGNQTGSLATIQAATSGYDSTTAGSPNVLLGAIVGFYAEQATSLVYNAASTPRGVWVADDPELVFEMQDNGSATLAYTDVGSNFLIDISTNSGSTATARSGHTMGTSASNTYAGSQLHLLGLAKRPKNSVGQYAVWEVAINNHANGARVIGVA